MIRWPVSGFASFLRSGALFLVLLSGQWLGAQDTELRYFDYTYVENLHTVKLRVDGFPNSYPIIELNGGARLRLSFDDLREDVTRYSYSFIHCNQDWRPSNLGQMEYNSGFGNDYIQDYDFSLRTLMPFTHYELVFPNADMRLEKSGNYLLVVYDTQDGNRPVITRRFMVSENVAGINGQVTRPAVVDKIHTHQEVRLTANTKQLQPRAPLQELSATVIQNGRWDNAVAAVEPNLLGRESVQFNYQDRIIFRGGNEFRNLDIRSVQAPRADVSSITNEGDRYGMLLAPELTRGGTVYSQYFDLNGDFVNVGGDRPALNLADEYLQENYARFGLEYTGEYVEIMPVLKTQSGLPLQDDVYLYGALTEWQKKPAYRMVWNPGISAYVGRFLIKQGFYNYYYVTDDAASDRRETVYEDTEGNHSVTENDYIALLYYRPLGGRYDRLVGSAIINSSL
ncbi:uncharacterized protein DUF5103 [Neolewinella xylanilytica]|uniref:Uncharacterized protein DUF5103 n=1 Tax=Neolewinella xylanilytica TaxID=1514080 RepID=A0A2S6I3J4_9BACT|nr:DUF5103 domain-containing protein [Neolewinella xylanilytica]PPK85735.1 uncharacterized protein DUF5103 [Neolewinella xylanilytica]